jgi:hypothetical protein
MNMATIYLRSVVAILTIGTITCLYIYMGRTDQIVIGGVYLDKSVSGDVPNIEEEA